jgi:hypothetical protein
MMRIEIYVFALGALLLSAMAGGMYERHVGYQQAKSEAAAALLAADARAAELTRKLTAAANRSDQALEKLRNQHARILAMLCLASSLSSCATAPPLTSMCPEPSTSSPALMTLPVDTRSYLCQLSEILAQPSLCSQANVRPSVTD